MLLIGIGVAHTVWTTREGKCLFLANVLPFTLGEVKVLQLFPLRLSMGGMFFRAIDKRLGLNFENM